MAEALRKRTKEDSFLQSSVFKTCCELIRYTNIC